MAGKRPLPWLTTWSGLPDKFLEGVCPHPHPQHVSTTCPFPPAPPSFHSRVLPPPREHDARTLATVGLDSLHQQVTEAMGLNTVQKGCHINW